MSENLRIVATSVITKIGVMLTAEQSNPEIFTPSKVTEYLTAFKEQLQYALRLDAAERKLASVRDTESVIVDLDPGLGYAMSNVELRQAINDTTSHLRPLMIGIQLSDLARQTLGDHLECLLQVEKARAGLMFTSTEKAANTPPPAGGSSMSKTTATQRQRRARSLASMLYDPYTAGCFTDFRGDPRQAPKRWKRLWARQQKFVKKANAANRRYWRAVRERAALAEHGGE